MRHYEKTNQPAYRMQFQSPLHRSIHCDYRWEGLVVNKGAGFSLLFIGAFIATTIFGTGVVPIFGTFQSPLHRSIHCDQE